MHLQGSFRTARPSGARPVVAHASHRIIQLARVGPVHATLRGEQQLDPLASDLAITQTSLLAQEIKGLPANQVSETLWGFTLSHGYDPALFATVAAVASDELDRYDPTSLVGILSAQAHVGHTDRAFVVAAAERIATPYVLAEVDAATLTQAVWTLALLDAQGAVRVSEEESILQAVTAVTKQAGRKMSDFSPDDLTRLLIGLAELGVPPASTLVEAATARLQSTLIPLAQLSPGNLADSLWAYARLGCYDRSLFDAAQAELQRKASQLDLQSLARVSWACSNVRDRDVKHRAVHDANFLALLAQQAVQLMDDNSSSSGNNTTAAPADASTPGASGSEAVTANTSVASSLNQPAPHSSVLTLLLSFANLSHTDKLLFQKAAKFLAPLLELCSAQELVVLAFVYARMKQSAPLLLDALADAVPQVLNELDGDDLVYLASVGPATSHYSDALMKVVMQRALELASADARSLSPGQLLDLARCVAAVSHHDPQHYDDVQKAVLKAVNAAHMAADMEDMSTHCGATNPLGLQK